MRTIIIAISIAAALLLAGCTASSAGSNEVPIVVNSGSIPVATLTATVSPDPSDTVKPSDATHPQSAKASDIAKAIDCTGYEAGTDGLPPGVTQYGTCTFKGVDTTVYVLASPDSLKQLRAAVKMFGVDPDVIVAVGRWAAAGDDDSVTDALRSALANA